MVGVLPAGAEVFGDEGGELVRVCAPVGVGLVEREFGEAQAGERRGVAVAGVDADGAVLASLGDITRPVFPRSAVKVLQAADEKGK